MGTAERPSDEISLPQMTTRIKDNFVVYRQKKDILPGLEFGVPDFTHSTHRYPHVGDTALSPLCLLDFLPELLIFLLDGHFGDRLLGIEVSQGKNDRTGEHDQADVQQKQHERVGDNSPLKSRDTDPGDRERRD